LLISNHLFSQICFVKNLNGEQIIGAKFITGDRFVTSDKNGKVDLSIFNKDDTLKIEHLSYQNKIIIKRLIKDNLIILNPGNFIIEEISIHSNLNPETNKTQVIKLNQKEILSSLSKNTAEILEKSTNITIQKSQSGGGSPNIRGFEANRILLVVDGIKLNNTIYRSGHLQNILTIDPYIIENLSVLHGPSSIFYGSGALGGAIVINTINPEKYSKNKSLFVQQYESSSNSILGHYHSIYHFKNLSFLSSVSLNKYGNIKMGKNRVHKYEDWGKDRFTTDGNEQLFGEYSQYDLNQKIYIELKNKRSIKLNSQFSTSSNINRYDKLNDLKNGDQKYTSWFYGPQKRILQTLEFKSKNKTKTFDSFSLITSYQNINESRHYKKKEDIFFIRRIEKLNIFETKINFNKVIKNIKINYGFENRFQNLNSDGYSQIGSQGENISILSRYPGNGTNVTDYSTFFQFELNLTEKSKLYSGIRYNINNMEFEISDNNIFSLSENNFEMENKNFSFSTNLSHYLFKNTFVSLSIFSAYRNPNIDDVGKIFSKTEGTVVVPNTNLRSEKILSTELIIKHSGRSTTFEMAVFNSFVSDAIEKRSFSINGTDSIIFDNETMMTIANVNVEKVNIKGLNVSLKHKINNFIFGLQASLVKGENSDSIPLAHLPPFFANFNCDYKISSKSSVKFYTLYNDWKYDEDFDVNGVDNLEEATNDGTPMWYTFNLNFTHQINDKLILSVALENMMDYHYKTFASGISANGRNLILNLQSKF